MTGDLIIHISVSYKANADEITENFAVSQKTMRKAQVWQAQQKATGKDVTSRDLREWLWTKECPLDSCDGPAYVRRYADGAQAEAYYQGGKLHREGGPADIWRFPSGLTAEGYYRGGRRHREDGPAFVRTYPDGATEEQYYRDGKLHRDDGPADLWRSASGSTVERYYRNGEFVKEEHLAPLTIIPGVKVRPPASKGPGVS